MNAPTQVPSKKLVAVDGELKPGDIDAPRLVLIRKLNSRGQPVGDFAYVAYWATDGNPAQQDEHAELIAAAVNGWQPLHNEIERLKRELEERPYYLDGLTIQQWREHAKAGWKMYAARAENEPRALQCTSGCQKPICRKFVDQDDGEGRVDTYCEECGHTRECHDPIATPPPGVTDRQRLEHYWKFCNVLTHPSYMDFQDWLKLLDEDRAERCPTATKPGEQA